MMMIFQPQNGDYDHGKFDINNKDTIRDNKEKDTPRKDEDNGSGGCISS